MEAAPKKGPGRPKKAVGAPAMPVNGIIETPEDANGTHAGLIYANPMMFKKIFHLLKQYAVSEINMFWGPTGIKIAVVDHLGKSHIDVTIEGACMNRYYCREPMHVRMRRGCLDHISQAIGKAHTHIVFVLKPSEIGGRVVMVISIHNSEVDSDNSYSIDTLRVDDAVPLHQYNDAEYPVKFHFASSHFKLLVSNARKLSKTLTFEKAGASPLRLTFPAAEDMGWDEVYAEPAKIGLETTLAEHDVFTVDISLDYIKPLASNAIGDRVHIAAHTTTPMSFTTNMDVGPLGAATVIKIFTDVIVPM